MAATCVSVRRSAYRRVASARIVSDRSVDGDFPSWRLEVQIMPYEDAKTYRFNPFDLTKMWPKKDYPRIPVGRFTLKENPVNHFAQIEQAAFSPSNTVPGTGISPDKMLLGRILSYPDAQRNRLGTNFNQLPVNCPVVATNSYDKEGAMQHHHSGDAPVYAPNSRGRAYQDTQGPVDTGGGRRRAGEDRLRAAFRG